MLIVSKCTLIVSHIVVSHIVSKLSKILIPNFDSTILIGESKLCQPFTAIPLILS